MGTAKILVPPATRDAYNECYIITNREGPPDPALFLVLETADFSYDWVDTVNFKFGNIKVELTMMAGAYSKVQPNDTYAEFAKEQYALELAKDEEEMKEASDLQEISQAGMQSSDASAIVRSIQQLSIREDSGNSINLSQ